MFKNSLLLFAIASSPLPLLLGCGSSGSGNSAAPAALSAQASLGEKIFKDTSLSASGVQACSTCHDPAFAHSPPNALAIQPGDPAATKTGIRKAPGIRYLATNTPFFFDTDGTPTGGFFWDGRAATPAEQAAEPFINPAEMANADHASVVTKLAAATYAADFKSVYGAAIFSDVEGAYTRMTLAIQAYEREDSEFNSFSSKFDAFLAGKTQLTQQELRGFSLFNDPNKGNCSACHPSTKGADGSLPLFTDFTYDNLGVPRNPAIPSNADPNYFDLGLCQRADLTTHTDLCGAFKVPSLRNVAQRKAFFHNGFFTTLKDALTFYVQRDTNPEKFYPLVGGVRQKFNDLPAVCGSNQNCRGNVNTDEAPYNRTIGQQPALSDSEIDDVVAFLTTLNDGFTQ
jgi:cytochrome c peroxidase